MWQIPHGTSTQLDIDENGTQGSGYRDNRVEYFFNPTNGAAHRQSWIEAGVISLMFGAGQEDQTTHRTDNNYIRNNAVFGHFVPRGVASAATAVPGYDSVTLVTGAMAVTTPVTPSSIVATILSPSLPEDETHFSIFFRPTDTGLSPVFVKFVNRLTGQALTPPVIEEVVGSNGSYGEYRFTYVPGVDISFVVDGGATITNVNDRYVRGVISSVRRMGTVLRVVGRCSGGEGGA
jgi:hypothetical protein